MTDAISAAKRSSPDSAASTGGSLNGDQRDEDVSAADTHGATSTEAINSKSHRAEVPTTSAATDKNHSLHPFVHWAQSQTHISLRVDLIQVKEPNITVSDSGSSLTFSAQGRGAQGLQDYHFSIDLYSNVDKKIDCHAIERYVLILIKKANHQIEWPRLTKQQAKFPWLRVDFDRYKTNDSDDDSLDGQEAREFTRGKQSYELLRQQLDETKRQQQQQQHELDSQEWANSNSWSKGLTSIFKRNIDILNPFSSKKQAAKNTANMKHDYRKDTVATDNSKNIARHALDAKKTYLFLYNLVMFIMFLKVYIVLLIKGLSGTVDDDIVLGAAFIIKVLTYTQLLETVHPMLGLVPGGPLMPFTQVIGRLLVNYFLSEPEIRLDSAPYAHYLFIVWSSIEIFRYSFYALRVFKVNIYPLTWCRYTLFLPLYPMGGFCESMVIFSTIKFYEKTGGYSIALPNAANISFSLPIALKIYTFLLLGPTIYSLMKYMWRQRCKQLKEKIA